MLKRNEKNPIMVFSENNLENELLETTAGRAVFDALVQANINLRTVPVEMVKQMLVEECRFLRLGGSSLKLPMLASC